MGVVLLVSTPEELPVEPLLEPVLEPELPLVPLLPLVPWSDVPLLELEPLGPVLLPVLLGAVLLS